MSSSSVPWDGTNIGSGPILLAGSSEGQGATFLVARLEGEQIHLPGANRLVEFVQVHDKEVFVGANLVPLAGGAEDQGSAAHSLIRACLRELAASSRWIELPLLDRLVRFARWDVDLRPRSLAALAGASGASPIEQFRAAYRSLQSASTSLLADAALPREPVFRLEGKPTGTVDLPGLVPLWEMPGEESAPLGVDVEFRGAVALAALQSPSDGAGLRLVPERLRALEERAEREYRRASELLARDELVREGFRWDRGDAAVLRNRRGFPETTDHLKTWLRGAADRLVDAQNRPAHLPRRPDGTPPLNPEHWGVWAGCDRSLWAWRHLYRTAELMRLGQRKELTVSPRYETLPALRSWEPNLAVYRRFGVRVFEPRPGHVFLAGRVCDLRLRCVAAVAVHQGYVARGQARLCNYLLRTRNPLDVVAEGLFIANEVRQARREQLPRQLPHDDKANDEINERTDEFREQAEGRFLEMCKQRSEEFRRWTRLVQALLDVTPLGLSNALLTALLRHDYGLDELAEPEVIRLIGLLAQEVAYELGPFLADRTEDVVGARLGMTSQEVLARFVDPDHLDTSGAAMRNALAGQGRRPLQLEAPTASTSSEETPRRADLYEHRTLTPGGRPTSRAGQSAVRQQEVLLAADEVMLEVAFALIDDGHRLLGLAGSEFVVEAPEGQAEQVCKDVSALASAAATATLNGLLTVRAIPRGEEPARTKTPVNLKKLPVPVIVRPSTTW
jgi:hypothetical protein